MGTEEGMENSTIILNIKRRSAMEDRAMNRNIKVMVLTGNGINCEIETSLACRLAGADEVTMVSIWDWSKGEVQISEFKLICFPGGFLDGDDLGAARACATRIKYTKNPATGMYLIKELVSFIKQGGLIIGICNGFQLLTKLGLLPVINWESSEPLKQKATVTFNTNSRFENRWVTLKVNEKSPSVFLRGIKTIELPVRHGEGRLIIKEEHLDEIVSNNLIPLYYADPVTLQPTETYPFNPNGSPMGSAGLCDSTGRVLGLMPHPECFWNQLNHPDWTRRKLNTNGEGNGLRIFKNAIDYLREND